MAAGRNYARAFGLVVKRRRERLQLSQEEMAAAAEIHRTYAGFLERGLKAATVVVARRIAVALGMTLPKLMAEVEREFTKLGGDADTRKGSR